MKRETSHAWPERLTADPEIGPTLRSVVTQTEDELRLERNFVQLRQRLDAGEAKESPRRVWLSACVVAFAVAAIAVVTVAVVTRRARPPVIDHARLPAASYELDDVEIGEVSTSGVPRNVAPVSYAPLQAELGYVERATVHAVAGRYSEAADELGTLLERYPTTSLRDEVRFRRADYLMTAGRLDEAVVWVRGLLAAEKNKSRAAALSLMLGDALQRTGNCTEARLVYDRALASTLDERRRALIVEARRRCDGS